MHESASSKKTIKFECRFVVLSSIFYIIRNYIAIYLCTDCGKDTYSERFSNQFLTDRVLQSPRGTIFDRNGNPLALSVTVNSVSADPTMMRVVAKKTPEEVADVLAPYVRISREEIIKKLNEDTAFVWIDRLLDVPNSNGIEAAIKEAKYNFITLHKESRRYYPNDTLLAPVLGFVGFNEDGKADAEGKAGLEATFG